MLLMSRQQFAEGTSETQRFNVSTESAHSLRQVRDKDFFGGMFTTIGASFVAQLVKNLPVVQETWARSLGWKDPLEKGKATHSSILAWRIPRTV